MEEVHHKPKEPMQRILDSIKDCLTVGCEIRENRVIIPEWELTIAPEIEQLDDCVAVINFHLFCPEWDDPLFECCAACAKDSDTAIGMAMGSFLFCFMQGIAAMQQGDDPDMVESSFDGKAHRWKLFKSNNVGMGESTGDTHFWDMLKPHIIKRLGDQKMCYIKVFASKAIGKSDVQIIGEVRINDVPSPELGKLIEDEAAKWEVEQFSSQKQFFFFKQEPETTGEYCYSATEPDQDGFVDKVRFALEAFGACESEEQHNAMYGQLVQKLNDVTLTEELLSFLPEIAAENAFSKMGFSEQIQISIGGAKPIELYKSQLSDYYPIQKSLFALLSSGVFGDQTDVIYRKLIGCSSIYNCVRQLEDNGSKLEDCKLTSLLFNTSKDFKIR